MRTRLSVRVGGTVQGVGFRPFVFRLANELGLQGFVGNDTSGVFIEAQGEQSDLDAFLTRLKSEQPALARVQHVDVVEVPVREGSTFAVVASEHASGHTSQVPVTADAATCDDCLEELNDPSDRRYRYPFINCTNCGPRFTIVREVPYDRANTTMSAFPMCASCRHEYEDPSNRRYHAEATCCPECGPRLALLSRHGEPLAGPEEAIERAVELLWEERVVAVKGLGGYHLAALAASERAVSSLRARKHREEKPFAVMVADLATARALCDIEAVQRDLLCSTQRPIVLARRRDMVEGRHFAGGHVAANHNAGAHGGRVAPSVAPGADRLGLMLPYTALHHLLLQRLGEALVLTSGNVSDEPIAYRDDDALERLSGIADAFLVHDRAVHIRTDDSVTAVVAGRPAVLRRSRGYAPSPIAVPVSAPQTVLACGAELKNTLCFLERDRAIVTHHIGDLENAETLAAFEHAARHYRRLFGTEPSVVAHDMHPEYLSTKYAMALEGVERVAVQHHHAHIASCLADNGVRGPVIGVAFDGLGMGDGSGTPSTCALWGGEVMEATLDRYERLVTCAPVAMPGGAAAVRQPWRMAAAYAEAVYGAVPPAGLAVVEDHGERWDQMCRLARTGGTLSPAASSIGRLFDAVGAVVCRRYTASFEGQAAVQLETLADPAERSTYPCTVPPAPLRVVPTTRIFQCTVDDLVSGTPAPLVAARFHNTVAEVVSRVCTELREERGLQTVALSGGVFQNRFLTERTVEALTARHFQVLTHRQVPANDGGISLGQAVVAAARGH